MLLLITLYNILVTLTDDQNYHQLKDLKYFDLDYDKDDDDAKITISLIMTSKFICRRCKSALKSNNVLHKHLKSCIRERKTYSIAINLNALFITFISIIKSNVDFNKDIDSEYNFREYQYAFIDISLNENDKFAFVCVNIEVDITLTNTTFFNSIAKNVSIKTMITSIIVRDLEINKHFTNKYVIVSMYFSDKDEKKQAVKAKITREIHLVTNLKTNMLIENDVLKSKNLTFSRLHHQHISKVMKSSFQFLLEIDLLFEQHLYISQKHASFYLILRSIFSYTKSHYLNAIIFLNLQRQIFSFILILLKLSQTSY